VALVAILGLVTTDVFVALGVACLVALGVAVGVLRLQKHRFFADHRLGRRARLLLLLLVVGSLVMLGVALTLAVAQVRAARLVLEIALLCGGAAGVHGVVSCVRALSDSLARGE
jgi:hypothetical protein